jgi:hypothetical protein
LLNSADGSFAPSPYSALALRTPSNPGTSFEVGDLVPVRLTNRSGTVKTYHWKATQNGVVISLGQKTVPSGHGADINVPTSLGKSGIVRIALAGTDIYVTMRLHRP